MGALGVRVRARGEWVRVLMDVEGLREGRALCGALNSAAYTQVRQYSLPREV